MKKSLTIITGYLGSGKTTLLNEILSQENNSKIALIVNDIGSINVDAAKLKENNNDASDSMVELQNGCICCTLKDSFLDEIEKLSKNDNIDKIMVEASGVSNPASIIEGFADYINSEKDINVYIDSVVTVVDAKRIYDEFLVGIKEGLSDENPDIINLVVDQIEFCNIIILNKCDILSREKLDEVKDVLKQIQPEAKIIETINSKLDINLIYNNEPLDVEKILSSSSIQKALNRESMDEDDYGIESFVYEERRPFCYDKFINLVENNYPDEVIRTKGYIWFAEDDMHVQLFEQAGKCLSLDEVSNWTAAFSKEEQEELFAEYPEILEDWDEKYGDRNNQLVFIGKNMNNEDIIARFDSCIAK